MGRAESFWTYNDFNRTISLGFKVNSQTKQELRRMYSKLNYLASLCAPDYKSVGGVPQGFMRGNILKLTVGDYLNETAGILTGLSFGIDTNTPWDLGRDKDGVKNDLALPHTINVSTFSFTPIESFIPRKVDTKWVEGQISENMNAPFISMGKGEGNIAGKGYNTLNEHGKESPEPYTKS